MHRINLYLLAVFIFLSFGSFEICFGHDRISGAAVSEQTSLKFNTDVLTRDEREWLAKHPKISIAPDPIFLPIEFIDSKGNYSGIAADYISLIEKKLGINFEKIHLKNWKEVLEKTKKREVDMWGAATPTPQRLEYMLFTQSFLKLPAVILARKKVGENLTLEAIQGMKVVVISGYGIHDYIKKKYPNFNLEVVPDIQTGLKKVSFGMADAMVVNIALATHYIEEEGITNLRIAGESGYDYEWALAARKDWPELKNILEKGLSLISKEDRKTIYRKWVYVEKDSWISFRNVLLIFVLALLLGGVISILALNRRLKNQVQARTHQLEFELIKRKQTQENLKQSNTLLDGIRVSQEQFINQTPSKLIFDKLLDNILALTKSEFGFIGEVFFDEDGIPYLKTHTISNIAWDEKTRILYKEYQEMGMEFRNLDSLFGAVITTEKPVISNDPSNDNRSCGVPEGHPKLKSFLGIPFHSNNKIIGMVGIANSPKGYDEQILDYLAPFSLSCSNLIQGYRNLNRRLLAEDDLKNYMSKLEVSNQELQSFASIASHDLQEPLRKIIAFGDRLHTRIPANDDKASDYLDRMQNSALRMRSLVEDLLQYTRVETKTRPFEATHLSKVVQTVLEDLETRLKESKGVVNFNQLPIIEADPVQIYQLFLNLIGNALKFHREGFPPVVNLDSVKMKNGFWEISVEDNGIGIDEIYADRIFKPFERLHGRNAYEGTGIGLTICNKIVARHGGKLTVKRQSINGVTFHITLPEKQNNGSG